MLPREDELFKLAINTPIKKDKPKKRNKNGFVNLFILHSRWHRFHYID